MRKATIVIIIFVICSVSILDVFAFSNLKENQKTPQQIQVIPTDAYLAQNWFDEYITQLQGPAELQLPLKEQWKFQAPSGMNAGSMNASVWQKYVLISYSQIDPNADLKEIREQQKKGKNVKLPMKHFVECYDIETGNQLWVNPYISGGLKVIPGYLFVIYSTDNGLNTAIIDYKQGNIIKTFPYIRDIGTTYTAQQMKNVSDFTEKWASDTRQGVLSSIYSSQSPVPLDINKWSADDAQKIFNIFNSYIMRHGAIKGSFLFPNTNDAVIIDTKRNLLYKSISNNKIYWKQICTSGTRDTILWKPPYIAIFSSPKSVTAYSIESGYPEWMYEFPASTNNGGPVYKFASLKDGILLITEPLTGIKDSKNLCAIKLSPSGEELFKQELTMKSLYQNLAISNGFLVLWTESELVCYGPTDSLPESQQVAEKTVFTEEQRKQEIEKLHKEYDDLGTFSFNRIQVCVKLSDLNDETMYERVITDFKNAQENQRSDYVSMLGILKDRRAIDILIPLLKDESFSVREKAKVSLQRLTYMSGIELIKVEDWQNWWIDHRHLYIK